MTMTRDDVPDVVSGLLGGRPVRWASPELACGDYDGRERTLDVFLADPAEQLPLLRIVRPIRRELEVAAGGPIIMIFHTPSETRRLYPDLDVPMVIGVSMYASQAPYLVRIPGLTRPPRLSIGSSCPESRSRNRWKGTQHEAGEDTAGFQSILELRHHHQDRPGTALGVRGRRRSVARDALGPLATGSNRGPGQPESFRGSPGENDPEQRRGCPGERGEGSPSGSAQRAGSSRSRSA